MKNTIKLTQKLIEQSGVALDINTIPEDNRIVKRFFTRVDITIDDAEERTAMGYISTIDIDIDDEIVLTDGMDLTRFEKNPVVLFNHDFNCPIAKSVVMQKKDDGLISKTVFGTSSLGEDIWRLVKDGILRTHSIGFIPMKYIRPDDPEFDKVIKKLQEKHPGRFTDDKIAKLRGIIAKSLLYEYSVVSVPANEDALMMEVSRKSICADTIKHLNIKEKEDGSDRTIEQAGTGSNAGIDTASDKTADVQDDKQANEVEKQKQYKPEVKIIRDEGMEKKPKVKIIGYDTSADIETVKRLLSGKVC
jgi:HK97 family phage prohead protease